MMKIVKTAAISALLASATTASLAANCNLPEVHKNADSFVGIELGAQYTTMQALSAFCPSLNATTDKVHASIALPLGQLQSKVITFNDATEILPSVYSDSDMKPSLELTFNPRDQLHNVSLQFKSSNQETQWLVETLQKKYGQPFSLKEFDSKDLITEHQSLMFTNKLNSDKLAVFTHPVIDEDFVNVEISYTSKRFYKPIEQAERKYAAELKEREMKIAAQAKSLEEKHKAVYQQTL